MQTTGIVVRRCNLRTADDLVADIAAHSSVFRWSMNIGIKRKLRNNAAGANYGQQLNAKINVTK